MEKIITPFKWLGGITLIVFLSLLMTNGEARAIGEAVPLPESEGIGYTPEVMLIEDDLPGFRRVDEMETVGYLALATRLTSGLTSPQTEVANVSCFRIKNPFQSEYIINFLAYPLSENDEIVFDTHASNPQSILEPLQAIMETSGSAGEPRFLPEMGDIGERSIGFSMRLGQEPIAQDIDFIWVRRGEILQSTWIIYPTGEPPTYDVPFLAQLVDQRVQEYFPGTTFRPAGAVVPVLTTHIPTPLDVSTRPGVIGTNLLLAALMMLPFAAATELFTGLLAEHDQTLRQIFHLPAWLSKRRTAGRSAKRKSASGTLLRLLAIMFFYGLIFSLLDREWQPFSIPGLVLFLIMTIAYGLVGIADDIIQWRMLRKWGTPAELSLRPTNILLSAASTLVSRLLTLVPGMMFGTPEALVLDEERLGKKKRNDLLRISAVSLLTISFSLWSLTTITNLLQRGDLPDTFGIIIQGLEAFLLVTFAVALENTFVQMLGLPGSFGEALRQRNIWLWLLGLTGITFIFYHTLINPRGELAEALQAANVWILLGVSGAFVLITGILWIIVRVKKRKTPGASRSRADSGKRAAKRNLPTWAWLAIAAVGIMAIGSLLVESLQAEQQFAADTPAIPDSEPTAELPATSQVIPGESEIFSFQGPSLLGKLCFVPARAIEEDLYDDNIWQSVLLVAAQMGAGAEFVQPDSLDDAGYRQAIDELLQRDCDLIIGGFLIPIQAFLQSAREHPDQQFMVLWGAETDDLPNMWITDYALGEGTYLAGYLGAGISTSGRVGMFGGYPYPAVQIMMACIAQGISDFNVVHGRAVEILGWETETQTGLFTTDFVYPEEGAALTSELISAGADVILPLAGSGESATGYGAAETILGSPGVSLIGIDLDWASAMPKFESVVVTSVEIVFEQSIAIAARAVAEGEFSGGVHVGNLASGEIRLSPLRGFADRVSPELMAELAELAAAPAPICQPSQPVATESAPPISTSQPSLRPTENNTPIPSITATSTATLSAENLLESKAVGERINLLDLEIDRMDFPAGNPFFIFHGFLGWGFDDELPYGYLFILEIDGVRREPDDFAVDPYDDEGGKTYMLLFNFPAGMTGTHTFVGTWIDPDVGITIIKTLIIDFVP